MIGWPSSICDEWHVCELMSPLRGFDGMGRTVSVGSRPRLSHAVAARLKRHIATKFINIRRCLVCVVLAIATSFAA